MNEKLSVVLPTYNRPHQLCTCIESILSQTYKDIEIIVSDDCSDTDTLGELKKHNYPNIIYTRNKKNMGISVNIKTAVSMATGRYIAFISDDDTLIDPEFYSSAIHLIKSKEYDMVFSRVLIHSEFGKQVKPYAFASEYTFKEFIEMIRELRFNYQDYFSLGSCVFIKEAFNSSEPFKSKYPNSITADFLIMLKYLYLNNKIGFSDKTAYEWNLRTGSLCMSNKTNLVVQAQSNLAFPFEMFEFIGESEIEPYMMDFLNKRVEYSFHAILADAAAEENEVNFNRVCEIREIKEGNVYIYCNGWVGKALQKFLENRRINFCYFIDDYSKDNDSITFDSFAKNHKEQTAVIIANYKHKDVYGIYKKLATINDIKIYDLFKD
jgi:glycosyltransferase involved in cell wall biosynthesis